MGALHALLLARLTHYATRRPQPQPVLDWGRASPRVRSRSALPYAYRAQGEPLACARLDAAAFQLRPIQAPRKSAPLRGRHVRALRDRGSRGRARLGVVARQVRRHSRVPDGARGDIDARIDARL